MTSIAQRRVAGATALMILAYLVQVVLFAPGAMAEGNPPDVQCASSDPAWNGTYFKVEVKDNGSLGTTEGDGSINLTAGSWTNTDDEAVFRVVYKTGEVFPDDEQSGLWEKGEGAALLNPQGLSHITWCFTEPSTTTTPAAEDTTPTTDDTTVTTEDTTPTTEDTTVTTEDTTATTADTEIAAATTVPFDTLEEEDDEAEVLGTTITTAPETAPEEVSADTLPFTGSDSGNAIRLALLALVSGALMLTAVAGPKDKEDAGDLGGWSTS